MGASCELASNRPTPSALRASSPPASGRGGKLSYKDQRDYDRLPGEIERLQAQIAADEQTLSDPDLYTGKPEEFARLTARRSREWNIAGWKLPRWQRR